MEFCNALASFSIYLFFLNFGCLYSGYPHAYYRMVGFPASIAVRPESPLLVAIGPVRTLRGSLHDGQGEPCRRY